MKLGELASRHFTPALNERADDVNRLMGFDKKQLKNMIVGEAQCRVSAVAEGSDPDPRLILDAWSGAVPGGSPEMNV